MQSMTGCGAGRSSGNGWEVTAELKTVNHRFLDIGLRLPRNLIFLEQTIREKLSAGIKRGHADVYISVRSLDESTREVQTDLHLARAYAQAAGQIAAEAGCGDRLDVKDLMTLEGVVTLAEKDMDQETVLGLCADAMDQAIDQLKGMRAREGMHLREDLQLHLREAEALREEILARAPLVVTEYRARLQARLAALGVTEVDPQRLAQETAIIADRCAIDEELARLESHLRQMSAYLDSKEEIGKKMDFLIQEMNREANTIGSKASDAQIAQCVVNLKSEIEKLREQVQNVE